MAFLPPVALVTGSASGIGRSLAIELASIGYQLLLVDQDEARNQDTRKLLSDDAILATLTGDVSDPGLWELAESELGNRPLSLLVNNAGIVVAGSVVDSSLESLLRQVEVNLLGTLLGCHTMLPHLASEPPAPLPVGVLNMASVFALLSPPYFAAYNASKAGIVALTESLHGELAPRGLQATVVLPGFTRTRLFESSGLSDTDPNEAIDGLHQQRMADHLDQSSLTPEVVARRALRAYRRGKLQQVIGQRARWYALLRRWFPRLTLEQIARKAEAEMG